MLPWLAAATALAFALGLYLGCSVAPDDYQQGATVKIMFIHVPAAWLAMCVLGRDEHRRRSARWSGAIRSPTSRRKPRRRSAPPSRSSACVTGSLWGRPMWGTYWVWDARLTSVLVLFLMYLGVIALWRTVDDPVARRHAPPRSSRWSAPINLPIIKFSVDWWNTLHQPASVFRIGGPTIHPSILTPLLVMALAFTLLFVTLHLAAMRNEILRRRVRTMRLMQAHAAQAEPDMDLGPHAASSSPPMRRRRWS